MTIVNKTETHMCDKNKNRRKRREKTAERNRMREGAMSWSMKPMMQTEMTVCAVAFEICFALFLFHFFGDELNDV